MFNERRVKNGTFVCRIDNAIQETRNGVYCSRITVALFFAT